MKKQSTVFLIDDNADVRETIGENLLEDGYEVLTAATARESLEKLKKHAVDIVLLDLELPDGNGLTLIRDIRKATSAPILIISGRAGMADKVVGLEMGADDYLGKPLAIPELLARVHAHLRRAEGAGAPERELRIRFGRWTLDRAQMQIFDENGRPGGLTVREFRLLEALVMSANRVLSREQLLSTSRDDGIDIFDRSIDIQVTRIRKKLGDCAKSPAIIRTVRSVGYMLVLGEGANGP